MRSPRDWSLRLRIFLFFALIALGGIAATVGVTVLAARAYAPEEMGNLVTAAVGGALGLLILCAWIWILFDENVARPIMGLSGELHLRANAKATDGTDLTAKADYLGALAPAAASVAGALSAAREESDAAVDSAIETMRAEKSRLEAVLRDLREGLVICNARNEVLLYNPEAQRLLGEGAEIGLGRPLGALLRAEPIRHALVRLESRRTPERFRAHPDHLSLPISCATCGSDTLLEGRIALVVGEGDGPSRGFALTLRKATRGMAEELARDTALRKIVEGLNRHTAAIAAAAEVLRDAPDGDLQTRCAALLAEEAGGLRADLGRLNASFDAFRIGGATMNEVSTIGLAACIADRLTEEGGPGIVLAGDQVWLHCDSFGIVALYARLSARLASEEAVSELALSAVPAGEHVHLDLEWTGTPVAEVQLAEWLADPLCASIPGITGRDIVLHHRSELWSETGAAGRARIRMPLLPARINAEAPEAIPAPRPEFYDFALMDHELPTRLTELPLARLSCVVFDTETTGLNPSGGDEIVQIAGLRVVNGRVLSGEVFDRLVNPGRPIPPSSTGIHGITDEMVAVAGSARTVLTAFHDFVGTDALIAHNAPFDMKFLKLKEEALGRRFDGTVLDTVLLAAHLFGQEAELSLDALARRFDLSFPEGKRHTALADAVVTAEVFCALLPALDAAGVCTVGDALAASDRAVAIRRKQSSY